MEWQLLTVGLFVAAAAGYLALSSWRTWSGRGKTCGGCSCPGSSPAPGTASGGFVPLADVAMRRR